MDEGKVAVLVKELVCHVLPQCRVQRHFEYSMRLLRGMWDEVSESILKDRVLKKLSAQDAERAGKLLGQVVLQKKWAFLLLMTQLVQGYGAAELGRSIEKTVKRPGVPRPHIAMPSLPEKKGVVSVLITAILSDLLVVFLGRDGQYVHYDRDEDGFIVQETLDTPVAVRKQMTELAEMGWLYNKSLKFLQMNMGAKARGIQCLCRCFETELAEYRELVALIEAEFVITGKKTLRQLALWCFEPLERLK